MKDMFYNAYVLPTFDYCCHIWGSGNQSNKNKINILQKRVARIMLHKPKRSPSSELLQELSWLTFTDRCKYHTATLVYKSRNGMAPQYISEILTFATNEHYELRSFSKHDLICQVLPSTNYLKESFSYNSMNVWNSIPLHIRNVHKLGTFKKLYKLYLLDNNCS